MEQTLQMEGYLHPLYAESFNEISTPLYLPRSKGWLLKRQIPGTSYFDAMGPYPLFFSQNYAALIEDLQALKDQLVSISLVIDPFASIPADAFQNYFDVFKEYKDHYLLDLGLPLNKTLSKNTQKNVRQALRKLEVRQIKAPDINLEEWVRLYDCLIKRHQITGIRAFSRQSFAKQIAIPNTRYFQINHNGSCVGAHLYYIQGNIAYSHLSAFTQQGYDLGAPYAGKWFSINHLQSIVRWVNYGGGTASKNSEISGLDEFKHRWSSTTGKAYYCGKILNRKIYDTIIESKGAVKKDWFPVYRSGDF